MENIEQEDGYVKYNGWIDKIKEMCNDETVVGFEKHNKRYYVHHVIDNRLHVYIAMVEEKFKTEICISDIQLPRVYTHEYCNARTFVRATGKGNIVINTGSITSGRLRWCDFL